MTRIIRKPSVGSGWQVLGLSTSRRTATTAVLFLAVAALAFPIAPVCRASVTCTVEPKAATNEVGTDHTIVVTFVSDGFKLAGTEATFRIASGPNAGLERTLIADREGRVVFRYTGHGGPGTDTIEIVGIDPDTDHRIVCSTATKTWIEGTSEPEPPDNGGTTSELPSCYYCYAIDTSRPPTDNVHLRRALSYAIDRTALAKLLPDTNTTPATTPTPPDPASEAQVSHVISFDPERARRELELAGGVPSEPVVLMYEASEANTRIAQAVASDWRKHLNIDVQLMDMEWQTYLKAMGEQQPQLFRLGWCSDYPDDGNWVLEVFHSTKGDNRIKWSNAEFDRLTDDAAAEQDAERRSQLVRRATMLLYVDEAAVIPLLFYPPSYNSAFKSDSNDSGELGAEGS